MSKSRGNAIFASDVLASEGADALRWYLLSSGAPYLPKRFDPNALKDLANKFLGTFRNLYNFYALYAGIDGFVLGADGKAPTHLLDRWVLSRYHSTARDVTEAMERYELNRAARMIQSFVIDELSNWYLRRSRRRFWKNEMSGDKIGAYETFSRVLEGVAVLSAPLIPFLSEAVFLGLGFPGRGPDGMASVHLEGYPECDERLIDADLERKMAGVLQAVTVGRAVRNKVGIKVRTPLAEMFVHVHSKKDLDWLGDPKLASLVSDELNVKKISSLETTEGYISSQVKPDFAQLGKRLGKNMKAVAEMLSGLPVERISSFVAEGEVSIEIDEKKEVIKLEEVQILQHSAEGFEAESEGGLTVILDTRLTPELVREGMARDLVNRIQNFRKESGLEVSDRIELSYEAPEQIAGVFEEYRDHICSETLAERLEKGEKDWHFRTALTLDGAQATLWLRRV
jgi:isoleucyl-tRNA synthetase